jgi:hypothetical protein
MEMSECGLPLRLQDGKSIKGTTSQKRQVRQQSQCCRRFRRLHSKARGNRRNRRKLGQQMRERSLAEVSEREYCDREEVPELRVIK